MRAKIAFFGLAAVGIMVGWRVCSFYDGKVADLKEAGVQSYAKSQSGILAQITEERDRLRVEKSDLSKEVGDLKIYHGKDAPPLRKRALILAQQIHDFIKDKKDLDYGQYMGRFSSRVVHMRDDLDQNGQDSEALDKEMTSFRGTIEDVRIIADEIEKLADKLSD